MITYYYRVAGFLFSVALPVGMDAERLLPSFRSFRVLEHAGNEERLFDFTVTVADEMPRSEIGELLEETARIIPTVETYCAMGSIHEKKGDYERAEACFREAADMIPSRITAKYQLFNLHLARKDTASAVRIGKELLNRPVKVEGTKTLRMKGEVRRKLKKLN